jgi:hypothetical protein
MIRIMKNMIVIMVLSGMILLSMSCTAGSGNEAEDHAAPVSLERVNSWSIEAPDLIPNPVYTGALEDGGLVIIDSSLNTINHFDSDGNHLATRGGEGRGPGEYQTIIAADIHPDGRVAIADLNSARVTILSLNDDEEITFSYNTGWNPQLHWTSRGLVVLNHPFTIMASDPGDILMRLYDTETKEKEKFYQMELVMSDPPFEQISCTFCRFRFLDDLSFFTAPQDTSYRIFRVNPETEEETLFRRNGVPPSAYTEEERAELAESRARGLQAVGVDPGEYRAPQFRNRFRDFFPDDSGRLWAVLNGPADEPAQIDIFSPEADYLGTLKGPERAATFRYTKGGYLMVQYRNDDPDIWEGGLYRVEE